MESIYLLRVYSEAKLRGFGIDEILRVSRVQESESSKTPFSKPWCRG